MDEQLTTIANRHLRLVTNDEFVPDASLDDALETFERALLADGKSPNTIRAYMPNLQRMAAIMRQKHPRITIAQVTKGMIDEVLTSPEVTNTERGIARSPASVDRYKTAIRSFFSWAVKSRLIEENPAASLKTQRLPRKPPRFLSDSEKRRLQKELRGRTSATDNRDRVIIELFLGTGIRLHELVNLDIDDIDLNAKHVHIRRAKGGSHQVKFLKTNLRTLLRNYLVDRRKQGDGRSHALFLSNRGTRITDGQVARRVIHWLRKAGIDKALGPHSLRHTFASSLYAATTNLLLVKQALGHQNIATTEIYTHLIDDALEEALERI